MWVFETRDSACIAWCRTESHKDRCTPDTVMHTERESKQRSDRMLLAVERLEG